MSGTREMQLWLGVFLVILLQLSFYPVHVMGHACETYLSLGSIIECQNFCRSNCANSFCQWWSKKCGCNDGFRMWRGRCEPVGRCICATNAECDEDDNCKCMEGYRPEGMECVPRCSTPCTEHKQCVEPEECRCMNGYLDKAGKCSPVCEQDCSENTYCAAPGICKCLVGYQEVNGICRPFCATACPQGAECLASGVCQCGKGYNMLDGGCQPVCRQDCGPRAYCAAPNTCQCNSGWELAAGHCKPDNLLSMLVYVLGVSERFLVGFMWAFIAVLTFLTCLVVYKMCTKYYYRRKPVGAEQQNTTNLVITYQPNSFGSDECLRSSSLQTNRPSDTSPPSYYKVLGIDHRTKL